MPSFSQPTEDHPTGTANPVDAILSQPEQLERYRVTGVKPYHYVIDGKYHGKDDPLIFDKDRFGQEGQEGYLDAMLNGLQFLTETRDHPLSVEYIKCLHKLVISQVCFLRYEEDDWHAYVPNLRNDKTTPDDFGFGLRDPNSSHEGIEEIQARYAKFIGVKVEQGGARLVVRIVDELKIKEEMNRIIEGYHYSKRTNLDIATFAHEMNLLHPFTDGNIRVITFLLINKLLLAENRPPILFNDPNVFDGFSCAQLGEFIDRELQLSGVLCKDLQDPFSFQGSVPTKNSVLVWSRKDMRERLSQLRTRVDCGASPDACKANQQSQPAVFVPADDSRHSGGLIQGGNAASTVFYSVDDPLRHFQNPPEENSANTVQNGTSRTLTAQAINPSSIRGKWDNTLYQHERTSAPVFVYRAYNEEDQEVGSMSFYQHPMLCRSEDGQRHNIIAGTGMFEQLHVNLTTLEEICASLPPTLFDRVVSSTNQSAMNGGVRGIANVVGYTLTAKNVSKEIVQAMQKAVGMTGYFLLRFNQHLAQDTKENTLSAVASAAYDTGSVFLAGMVIDKMCDVLSYIGQCAEGKGWSRTGQLCSFFSRHRHHAIYAFQANQHGIVETTAALVAGGMAEKVVEEAGKGMTHRCLGI